VVLSENGSALSHKFQMGSTLGKAKVNDTRFAIMAS
jgi:hypothetical protein